MRRILIVLCISVAGAGLAACDTSPWIETGKLTVRLADGPVDDALAVVITVEAVAIEDTPYEVPYPLDPARQIDVLRLTAGRSETLLDRREVLATRYEFLRLQVSADGSGQDAWVDTATGRHALYLPDANAAGLRVATTFSVPAKGTRELVADLDLRQSLLPPAGVGQPYVLDPVVRVVDVRSAGAIEGIVSPSLAGQAGCTAAVYAFSGASVVPDDIDRQAPEPVTEAGVYLDGASGEYRYGLAFLPAGDYTLGLTCQAGLDVPDADDSPVVLFQASTQAQVAAGQTTRVDF